MLPEMTKRGSMRRKTYIVLTAIFLLSAVSIYAQQHRPYNEIMKDVAATFPILKKNLDANNLAAAAEDAAKLEGFFTETEAFWIPLKARDAIGFSKRAREAAAAIGTAAKANDTKAAQTSYAVVQRI